MQSKRIWPIGIWIMLIIGSLTLRADGPGFVDQLKQAVASTKISLSQAVEIAQQEVPGGKVVDAELKWDKQPVYFEVEMLVGDKLKEVKLDAGMGKLLGLEDQKLYAEDRELLAEAQRSLAAAKLTALQAIEAATKAGKEGKPIAVALTEEKDQPAYAVKLLQGDKLLEVKVDGGSGKVLAVSESPLPLAVWTFDTTEVGKTPAGFRATETRPGKKIGQWKIVADSTAPSKPNVLNLTTEAGASTFNLALIEKTAFKDLDLRVRLRANSGKEDQGGGLIWRCKDENNYYVCRLNPLENNFRVYKVVDGKRQQLDSAEVKAETGEWYQMRAVMVGDHMTCYVDGKKYLTATDTTFAGAGQIGLWTKADASSSFDSLVVYAPPAEQPEEKGRVEQRSKRESKEEGDRDDDD